MRDEQSRLMRTDKLTSLGVLASAMAHDIKRPNQILRWYAGILKRACPEILVALEEHCDEGYTVGGLDESEFRSKLPDIVATIENCSRNIEAIAGGLGDFSNEIPPKFTPDLDINAVVGSAVDRVR